MARIFDLQTQDEEIRKALARGFQSGHVNFLLGSGASLPAIPAAGAIEQEIASLIEEDRHDEARDKIYNFLASIQLPRAMVESSVWLN